MLSIDNFLPPIFSLGAGLVAVALIGCGERGEVLYLSRMYLCLAYMCALCYNYSTSTLLNVKNLEKFKRTYIMLTKKCRNLGLFEIY